MYSAKRRLGNVGENVAVMFLEKQGFKILERNYLRKWGELDIVAYKNGILRFVEVKSVSGEIGENVPQETLEYRPEENMNVHKLKRLHRTIQTYLLEKGIEDDWQLDLVTVRIDKQNHKARAILLENIII